MRAICFEDLSSAANEESMYKARGARLGCKTRRSLAAAWHLVWLIELGRDAWPARRRSVDPDCSKPLAALCALRNQRSAQQPLQLRYCFCAGSPVRLPSLKPHRWRWNGVSTEPHTMVTSSRSADCLHPEPHRIIATPLMKRQLMRCAKCGAIRMVARPASSSFATLGRTWTRPIDMV